MFVWLVALGLASGTGAAANSTSLTYQLDIPRQTAIGALKEFKRQTGRRVISFDDPSSDLGPLRGHYTAEAALQALLRNTGITFTLKDDAFVIFSLPDKFDTKVPGPANAASSVVPAIDAAEIVVVGQRSPMEPPRTPSAILFHAKDIELQGPSQIASLLANLSQQPFTMNRPANGAQFPEFRGLGIDTTVVTINGRRAPSTVGEITGAFDLSLIPVAAVAGMNVALESTAVEYGLPAAGGIVDIELKHDTDRPNVEVQYGSAEGGADERRFSMGTGLEQERLSISFVVEHFERDFLLGSARALWRDQDYRRFGGSDYRVTASAPGNIASTNGDNLPGLSSPFAALLEGTTDFQATAGTVNRASLNRYYSALPAMNRSSVVASVDFDLTGSTSAFGELLYTHRDVKQQFSPPVVSEILPATNPYNPFGMPILVNTLLSELAPRRRDTDSNFLRSAAGLKGRRPSWNWELAAVSTIEDVRAISSNDLDRQRLSEALATTDPSRALNVLDPTSAGSQQLLEQLVAQPTGIHFRSNTTTVTGTMRREVEIAQRPLSTLFGAEWEQTNTVVSHWAPAQRTVASTFAQLGVPLSRSTTLSLGSRVDRVSDVGGLLSPQLAFEWRPLRSLVLHASAGKSRRAASLANLFEPIWVLQTPVFDRSRQQVSTVDVLVGGNPDLEPVTARTFAAGFSLQPDSRWLRRLAAKYWRIGLDDRITVPAVSFLLEHEDLYPSRVTRSTATAADSSAGRPGSLQLIDITRMNGGRLDTSGVDLETSLSFDTSLGDVTTNLAVTIVDRYASAELPGLPRAERAGIASTYGTVPRWRAVASFELDRPFGTLATTLRHVPAYADAYIETTGRMIPSQTLVDLKVVMNLDRASDRFAMPDGLKLTLGMENVFDAAPHFAEVGMSAGYDISQGDLRQRFAFVKIAREF